MKTLIFEGDIKKVAATLILSKITKKAFNLSCSPISFKEYKDEPLPKEDWIKVRNIQAGICGSDMTFYTCAQSATMAMYPIPCSDITYLGHETVGVVEEVGPQVKSLKVGDRVVLKEYMQCCSIKGYDEFNNQGELREITVKEIRGNLIITAVITATSRL